MSRPAVPNPVKRQLRQEAGFGCCNCGHPFIQYHHIVPWAEEEHFRPEDMMALCANCHHLCTSDAWDTSEQRSLKGKPRNIIEGNARGLLFVNKRDLVVQLAGGVAVNTPNLLVLNGETALGARLSDQDGRVLISAHIHDKEGRTVGQLVDNEWVISTNAVWDVEAYPRKATVRSAPRDIAFSVDTRDDSVRLSGKWFHSGMPLIFSEGEARIGASVLMGASVSNCMNFIVIG